MRQFLRKLRNQDRRRADRRQVAGLVAYYWDGGGPVAHPVREISSTGMYLLTEARWYVGTVVAMRLQWTDEAAADRDGSVAVQAKVIWLGPDGVGVTFLPPEQSPSPDRRDRRDKEAERKSLEELIRRSMQ